MSSTKTPRIAAIVNGMALVVCIYTTADLSGAHLNPAVTLSLTLGGFHPLLHGAWFVKRTSRAGRRMDESGPLLLGCLQQNDLVQGVVW